MSQVVQPQNLASALDKVLVKFNQQSNRAADLVLKETMKNMFGSIIEQTPVGDFDPDHAGTLKANWMLSQGSASTATTDKQEGGRTRSSLKFPKKVFGKTFYLTNNLPYINVVEYGGYPKKVKRGTFNKVTGQWQIRSRKGFSRQAAKGMVRRNLDRLNKFLNEAANKMFGKV